MSMYNSLHMSCEKQKQNCKCILWDKSSRGKIKFKGKIEAALSSRQKLKNIFLQTKLGQVYKTLLESHLRYSDALWGSLPDINLDHLQNPLPTASTVIEGTRLKDGWSCSWLSVSDLTKFDRTVIIYKIMNCLSTNTTLNKKLKEFLQ